MICKMKKHNGELTDRERRKISEDIRAIFMAYNLEYLFITRE